MASLFVRNLHPAVTDAILAKRFAEAGHVQSVHICRDKKTGSPLGNAYVNFRYGNEAQRALNKFNSELLLGRPMRVTWSNPEPKAKAIEGGKIFIKNLDRSVNSIFLFDTFSKFGRIASCKAVESKGFGFVQYESPKAAALAIQHLHGKVLNNRQITIEYFKSREAEMRKAGAQKAPRKPCQTVRPPCSETRTPDVETPRAKDTIQTIEASATEDTVRIDTASSSTVAEDKVETVETASPETLETAAPEETTEVPKCPPPQKRLTIYLLESAALEDQVQMAHDYMLPLIEEIHPTDANQITWMIVQEENNFEIMNIISDPELLRSKVDKMDALLRARAAGYKPETLKMMFKSGNKKKNKKKNKKNNQ